MCFVRFVIVLLMGTFLSSIYSLSFFLFSWYLLELLGMFVSICEENCTFEFIPDIFPKSTVLGHLLWGGIITQTPEVQSVYNLESM